MLCLLALDWHWYFIDLSVKQIVKEIKILKEGVFFGQYNLND